jgi:hypothetical protein
LDHCFMQFTSSSAFRCSQGKTCLNLVSLSPLSAMTLSIELIVKQQYLVLNSVNACQNI